MVSVGLAVVWIVLVPRTVDAAGGPWLARQDTPDLGFGNLLRKVGLIGETRRSDINPPLWSLAWERWFSLLLPVFVALAAFTPKPVSRPICRILLGVAVLCALASIGYVTTPQPLMYLLPFAWRPSGGQL